MFGMGMGEIILIAVVALLVLGPERLPGAAKAIGKGIRDLRAQTKDLQQTIEKDTQIGDAVREIRGALRGDPETLYKRATGEDFDPEKWSGEGEKSDDDHDDLADGEMASDAKAEVSEGEKPGDDETEKSDPEKGEKAAKPGSFKFAKTPPPPIPPKKADKVGPPKKADKVDADLPLIRTAPGALARGDQASEDKSGDTSSDEPSDTSDDKPLHG